AVSDWITVDQAMIDLFAEATRDRQYIHVDPQRAGQGPFGTTIAHGFLVLSLVSHMFFEAAPEIACRGTLVNYGCNRLRFVSPVRAGSRVRGRFVLKDAAGRGAGQTLLTLEITIEIEGEAKPALILEWLALSVPADAPAAG